MELMNESRRRKRIAKVAAQEAQKAADSVAPSKRVKLSKKDEKQDVMAVEDVDDDDANADLIMSFDKKEKAARKNAAQKAAREHIAEATVLKVSKTKQKALQKLKERQEREAKRGEIFESLKKHAVNAKELELLKSSRHLGSGRATKKQRLSQALRESRAGIQNTDATGLVVGMQTHATGESARARRKRLQREQEELEVQETSEDEDEDDEDKDAENEDEEGEDDRSVAEADEESAKTKQEAAAKRPAAEESVKAAAVTQSESKKAQESTAAAASAERKPAFYVTVKRIKAIQDAREKLPMYAEEQPVMEAIAHNDVVILCGSTGCGKSTQLPQFMYEAGYGHAGGVPGMIGCTQPRRVAAVTTAKRIAKELNVPLGKEVGFQVRYEKRVGKQTKVKVMTDGILLKEMQSDFLLSGYSAIIVDEAHERGVNSDILIGLLSRLVMLRRRGVDGPDGKRLPPLKVIVMSATLRVTDFTDNINLFPTPPPVIEVPSRQFSVTVHFSRRTNVFGYLEEAKNKVCKIHRRLPGGGILVFLTGRREIDWMCKTLREELSAKKKKKGKGAGKKEVAAIRDGPLAEREPSQKGPHEKREGGGEERAGRSGELEEEEAGEYKEGFRFGEDDGADSDAGDGGTDGGESDGEADALSEDDAQQMEEEEEEEEEDVAEEEYDLSDSDGEDGEGEEGEDENGDRPRIVTLDAKAIEGRPEAVDHAGANAGQAAAEAGAGAEGQASGGGGEGGGAQEEGGTERAAPKRRDRVRKRPERVLVLPLYSMLSAKRQLRVFQPAPKGVRLIVVATNVAETSITIPGIRYVVDTGRVKEHTEAKRTGIGGFKITWTSKAGADQRAGRAGRTGPGHCYRLFSSAVFDNQFEAFAPPAILKSPIDGVLLQMKAMCIPDVRHFPYPTPPDETDVQDALTTLVRLGALADDTEEITPLGRSLAAFPLAPRFSKMLVLGHQGGCLPYVVSMVSALSVENPVVYEKADAAAGDEEEESSEEEEEEEEEEEKQMQAKAEGRAGKVARKFGKNLSRRAQASEPRDKDTKRDGRVCRRDLWSHPGGDMLAILKALGAYTFSGGSEDFAVAHGLQPKLMGEIASLVQQLQALIVMHYPRLRAALPKDWKKLPPPSAKQETLLRQVLLAGLVDRVAKRDPSVKYGPPAYQTMWTEETVHIHQHSCMRSEPPPWVVYLELSAKTRVYMKGVAPISPQWLPELAASLCDRTSPVTDPLPRYDAAKDEMLCVIAPIFGPRNWEIPAKSVCMPDGPERYKHFARMLLEGRVLRGFEAISTWLTDRPLMITRSWGSHKASRLLAALQLKKVSSKAALLATWATDPSFLLAETLLWTRKEHHVALRAAWPLKQDGEAAKPGARPGKRAGRGGGEDDTNEFASGSESESEEADD